MLYDACNKKKGAYAHGRNEDICGKIPLELHTKVRQEIEERQISTQEFIQRVIEEHFMEKGEMNMAKRTIAVQVSEEFFTRLKKAVAWKGMKQNAFLISVIEAAIKEAEALMGAEEQESLTDVFGFGKFKIVGFYK